jgi:hypothetical protein
MFFRGTWRCRNGTVRKNDTGFLRYANMSRRRSSTRLKEYRLRDLYECNALLVLNDLESRCPAQCVNAGVMDRQDQILKVWIILQARYL